MDYNSVQELRQSVTYEYNDQGHIIRFIKEDKNGLTKATYEYNDRGDLVSRVKQDIYGSSTETMSYIYDVKGNWISKRSYLNNALYYIQSRVIEYYD